MAEIKRLFLDWDTTGITVYCIIRREVDDYRLNDADGSFASSPADPYVSLSEDAVIKGRYEKDESRSVWDDGRYTVAIYSQAGGSPAPVSDTIIGTGELAIDGDLEVYLDQFTATREQLSGLANVGSAVNRPAESYTLTTGTQSANTYVETQALDDIRHEHTDNAGAMDLYYQFNVGSGTPSSVSVTGYITGNNDDLDVFGYDWIADDWVQIGNIQGLNSTANRVFSFDMFVNMVGSAENSGVVRIRFYKASGLTTALLAVDQIFVAYNFGASGYEGGAVWIDTNASNTNTVVGVDGTTTNPVSTIGAANTLLAATNLKRLSVAPGSNITLEASQETQVLAGALWELDLNGQSISASLIVGAEVSGVGTGANAPEFKECDIEASTLPPCEIKRCSLEGRITLGAGFYHVHNPHGHEDAVLDYGAAIGNTEVNISDFSGDLNIENLGANGTDSLFVRGHGKIILAANCVGGSVKWDGHFTITNNGSGITITKDEISDNVDFALEQIGVAGAGLTAIIGGDNDTLETLSDQMDSVVTGGINVVSAIDGTIQAKYATDGGTVEVVRGDTVAIPYDLTVDMTNKKLYFAAKKQAGDQAYMIDVTEVTSGVTDALAGQGVIPLTSAMLTGLPPQTYDAEMEMRDGDGISNRITVLKFKMKVVEQVITFSSSSSSSQSSSSQSSSSSSSA